MGKLISDVNKPKKSSARQKIYKLYSHHSKNILFLKFSDEEN